MDYFNVWIIFNVITAFIQDLVTYEQALHRDSSSIFVSRAIPVFFFGLSCHVFSSVQHVVFKKNHVRQTELNASSCCVISTFVGHVFPAPFYVSGVLGATQAEIEHHLEMGRKLLAAGQLAEALSHYHSAVGKITQRRAH